MPTQRMQRRPPAPELYPSLCVSTCRLHVLQRGSGGRGSFSTWSGKLQRCGEGAIAGGCRECMQGGNWHDEGVSAASGELQCCKWAWPGRKATMSGAEGTLAVRNMQLLCALLFCWQ